MRLKFLTYMWIILDMCAVYIEHNEYESKGGDLYMKIVQLRDNICESAEKIKPGSCIEEE